MGVRIREIWEACFHLHKVGAQVENPLQCYRSAEEGTTALRAALAVVEHNRPGFESHRQQPHWPRLTAQAHEAALFQLNALAASLRNLADKLTPESRGSQPSSGACITNAVETLWKRKRADHGGRPWSHFAGQPCEKAKVGPKRMTGQSKR